MVRFIAMLNVDDKDFEEYRGNLDEYLESRLDEVYGDDGTVLSTMHLEFIVRIN